MQFSERKQMILSDHDLRARIEALSLAIHPLDETLIQPASIDLRLGPDFIFEDGVRDHLEDGQSITIWPGAFMLGRTMETIGLPDDLCAQVWGKSSWARKGLLVHITAGWVDPGFVGTLTLEFSNLSHAPLLLSVGKPICQLVFLQTLTPSQKPYGAEGRNSKYQFQHETTESKL